jgi:galactoside O-acetyltransferase
MGVLNHKQLSSLGLKYCGSNVQISDKASFYNPGSITIHDNSRIDDFCVLSAGEGGIEIGRNVHLAVFVSLIGKGRITISDFANFSSRISVYSSNDDYSGEYMTNPTIDEKYTNVTHDDVFIGKHVIIGTGCVILPGVKINEGASIGSLSLVKEDCIRFGIYAGIPAKFIKPRMENLLELEEKLKHNEKKSG